MARFSVDCETCSFATEAASVAAALSEERAHRCDRGEDHRVTIERRPRARERASASGGADGRPSSDHP